MNPLIAILENNTEYNDKCRFADGWCDRWNRLGKRHYLITQDVQSREWYQIVLQTDTACQTTQSERRKASRGVLYLSFSRPPVFLFSSESSFLHRAVPSMLQPLSIGTSWSLVVAVMVSFKISTRGSERSYEGFTLRLWDRKGACSMEIGRDVNRRIELLSHQEED